MNTPHTVGTLVSKGTRIVQADSGSDSESESRCQSSQSMSFV